MTTFYFLAYKCSLCGEKFNDGLCYVGLGDALNHVPELENINRFITANMGISALETLRALKGLMEMNDIWTKLGVFLGHMLAMTIVICAWLIIVVVTLKVIWFTLFRILV